MKIETIFKWFLRGVIITSASWLTKKMLDQIYKSYKKGE